MAFTHSSIIVTGAAVDTRARDGFSFPFLARPQAMTIYVRFVEMGTVLLTSVGRIFDISNGVAPRFLVQGNGANYTLFHITANGQVTSSPSGTPSIGQIVELRAVLNGNGSVVLGQTINGATETVGATSAALTLAQAWSVSTIFLNGANGGAFVGFAGFRNVEAVAGVHTMQEMRVWTGTD